MSEYSELVEYRYLYELLFSSSNSSILISSEFSDSSKMGSLLTHPEFWNVTMPKEFVTN